MRQNFDPPSDPYGDEVHCPVCDYCMEQEAWTDEWICKHCQEEEEKENE